MLPVRLYIGERNSKKENFRQILQQQSECSQAGDSSDPDKRKHYKGHSR